MRRTANPTCGGSIPPSASKIFIMAQTRKVIFMGTPHFALPALQALINSAHEVVAVYTAPPKPAGRGKEIKKSPVHELAESHNIPVFTPASLKAEQLPPSDVAVVAAYGILLPEHILNAPEFGCINIHPSLLPRWRGAAPIQRTIMEGDKTSAVCIMQMDKGLDTGDILMQGNFEIDDNMTAGELHDFCAKLGAEMTLGCITALGSITPVKQSSEGVTYARKIIREDEIINWDDSAEKIRNQVRGLNPFPGAYFMHEGKKIKLFEVEVETAKGNAGEVLDDKLLIACGNGAVRIKKLQKEGKRPMTAAEFLNGSAIQKGTKL